MALVDLFLRTNQARRILFVADRDALVDQALNDGFKAHLPHEPCTRIFSDKIETANRLFVVTLQTLNLCYQAFTPGFFDLIIFDEVHRSIFNKWNEVLQYFDARMIGLTATPAGFIDRNTFLTFDCDDNLPTFIVLQTKTNPKENNQPVSSRLWSSGFLSSEYAGVGMRSDGDPVLYLADPAGVDRNVRREMLDTVEQINRQALAEVGDPETNARIAQYEMAFRMQSSVPELTDLSKEPQSTWDLYGPEARQPGTFAYNCLLARRMAERGVRFTQIYKRGWDVHGDVVGVLPTLCQETDRGTYALVTDLKRRGLLDDTLVIWAGEFGRTVYSQGGLTQDNYGRDHHPRCFTTWMTGGGVRPVPH